MAVTKRWKRYSEDFHRCPRCGVTKPLTDFYADKGKSNGRRFICKACDNETARRYYQANRESKLAKANARNDRKRAEAPPKPARACLQCGADFVPRSSRSKRCPTCAADGLSTTRALAQ
jgi:hypothetical protein